jgi:hypothetical protein
MSDSLVELGKSGDSAAAIEQWFDRHDDGDFCSYERRSPYTIISPATTPGSIVFATKGGAVHAAISHDEHSAHIGLITRCGLPCPGDVQWIRPMVAPHEVLFLGDMDPPDLLIFAWLRLQLHPQPIRHLGVNDEYIRKLQIDLPASFQLELSQSEKDSLELLGAVLPGYLDLIGPNCTALLQRGRKIELEATVSAKRSPNYVLRPALAP